MPHSLRIVVYGKISHSYQTARLQQYIGTLKILSPFLGAFAKLQKVTIGFIMSVGPHATTRLLLDGF